MVSSLMDIRLLSCGRRKSREPTRRSRELAQRLKEHSVLSCDLRDSYIVNLFPSYKKQIPFVGVSVTPTHKR